MSYTVRVGAVLTALAATIGAAHADTLLYASVTSDGGGLYTYNYEVDNTNGVLPIYQINILVTSTVNTPPLPGSPTNPGSYSSPSGWIFEQQVSYAGAGPVEAGGFYTWYGDGEDIPVGSIESGFSFTVDSPPSTFALYNYFLDGVGEDTPGEPMGPIASGITLVPFVVTPSEMPPTPIPDALPLFTTGLGALGLFGWRRRQKSHAIAARR